jgi:hypothetical protein
MSEDKSKNLKEVFKSDESFLDLLKQSSQSEAYRRAKKNVEKGPHPTNKMLYDYVLGWTGDIDDKNIMEHIGLCSACNKEVLEIMKIEEELEDESIDWANKQPLTERLKSFISSIIFPKDSIFPKRLAVAATGCLVVILAVYFFNDQVTTSPSMAISIKLGVISSIGEEEITRSESDQVEIKKGGVLKSGDRFKINFSIDKDAYVYVLSRDSLGKVSKLFFEQVSIHKKYSIPNEWYHLDDNIGKETIYIIASHKPIDDINSFVKILESSEIVNVSNFFPEASIEEFYFEHK